MKTEDILNIDCRKTENRKTVNRFLWKVKPCAKMLEKKGYTKEEIAPIEVLEQVLHGLMIHYSYTTQGFTPYYENGEKFVFFQSSVIKVDEERTRHWCGTVYGVTIWEVMAKTIIKIYAEIMKERRENG